MLLGTLVVGLSLLSYWQLARMTPDFAALVSRLERDDRSPGQPHPALERARASLADLRARDGTRWHVGGYALSHAIGIVLGAGLLALGVRARTG